MAGGMGMMPGMAPPTTNQPGFAPGYGSCQSFPNSRYWDTPQNTNMMAMMKQQEHAMTPMAAPGVPYGMQPPGFAGPPGFMQTQPPAAYGTMPPGSFAPVNPMATRIDRPLGTGYNQTYNRGYNGHNSYNGYDRHYQRKGCC